MLAGGAARWSWEAKRSSDDASLENSHSPPGNIKHSEVQLPASFLRQLAPLAFKRCLFIFLSKIKSSQARLMSQPLCLRSPQLAAELHSRHRQGHLSARSVQHRRANVHRGAPVRAVLTAQQLGEEPGARLFCCISVTGWTPSLSARWTGAARFIKAANASALCYAIYCQGLFDACRIPARARLPCTCRQGGRGTDAKDPGRKGRVRY